MLDIIQSTIDFFASSGHEAAKAAGLAAGATLTTLLYSDLKKVAQKLGRAGKKALKKLVNRAR